MGTRVYVGRVSHHARERDIERFFKGYGRIRDVMLKNGYCFVEFDDDRDADDAVYELNGKELMGERIVIEHARGTRRDSRGGGGGGGGYSGGGGGGYGGGGGRDRDRGFSRREPSWLTKYGPPTRTDYRVIVENLSSRASWQDLKDYMRQAGDVTYADAHRQRKNEGVVDFTTKNDMRRAIEKLDGTEINGRKIRMVEDRPSRRRRSYSRSRSRSRSHSRTRSRSRSRSRSRRSSRSRSRSRSRSEKRSRSRSRSRSEKRSRTRSKSRSKTPEDKGAPEEN